MKEEEKRTLQRFAKELTFTAKVFPLGAWFALWFEWQGGKKKETGVRLGIKKLTSYLFVVVFVEVYSQDILKLSNFSLFTATLVSGPIHFFKKPSEWITIYKNKQSTKNEQYFKMANSVPKREKKTSMMHSNVLEESSPTELQKVGQGKDEL